MTGFILKAQVVAMTNILERKTKDKNSGIHILLPRIFTIDGQIDIVTLYRYVQFLM